MSVFIMELSNRVFVR